MPNSSLFNNLPSASLGIMKIVVLSESDRKYPGKRFSSSFLISMHPKY